MEIRGGVAVPLDPEQMIPVGITILIQIMISRVPFVCTANDLRSIPGLTRSS